MRNLTPRQAVLALAALLAALMLSACAANPPAATAPAAPASSAPAAPAAKIAVDSLDDLPVHTYPLSGTVTGLLEDPEGMIALRAAFKADLLADLAAYDITDPATLRNKYGSLLTLSMVEGDYAAAEVYLEKIGALEDKEAARLMTGLTARSMMEAKAATGTGPDDPAFQEVFGKALAARLDALPWEVVQDQAKNNKGRAEFMTRNMLLGVVQANVEPAAAAMGELTADLAGTVIGIQYALDNVLPLNPVAARVYGDYIAKNDRQKANIWPEREFALEPGRDLQPVVIGIWDSGVDEKVFGEAMFTNPGETVDGRDDDGNGFVDDVHGIAFDVDGVANPHLLHPLGDQEGKLDEMFESMQGFQDLTSAIDSPEATATRARLAAMEPDQMADFMTTLGFGSLYMHGTHVAGIASAGNPYARLLAARIAFDYHNTPKAMTVETARRLAEDYRNTTRYFRDHGVRIVNMSWGWTFKEIEGSLEANGVGQDAAERAAMAREMIGILSEGLEQALAATPGILYVVAAGNDDSDVDFDVVIPSSFTLPNVMVVGAVDQAGDPTSFTSGGRNVKVYANGFQVESFIPGGKTMKASGTSMSAPNVCNLAAKLLTLEPQLTPVQVIDVIERGADPHPEHPDILLLNPRASLALLP